MNDRGLGVASDGKGGAFVTGDFSGNASFGEVTLTSNGASDVFVMHVNSSGAVTWAKHAGGPWHDHGFAITADGTGGAFVTGGFGGRAYFGSTWLTSVVASDAFVWRIRGSGDVDWAVQTGSVLYAYGSTIASNDAGGALISGSFEERFDLTNLFLMHVSEEGVIVWSSALGVQRYRFSTGIISDGHGGAFVTGTFIDNSVFGSVPLVSSGDVDTYLVRVNCTGGVVWAVQMDSDYSVVSAGIVQDGAGGVLVTGRFACWVSSGSETIRTAAYTPAHSQACAYDTNIFLARFDQNGVALWMMQAGGELRDSAAGLALDGVGGAVLLGSVAGDGYFAPLSNQVKWSTAGESKGNDLIVARLVSIQQPFENSTSPHPPVSPPGVRPSTPSPAAPSAIAPAFPPSSTVATEQSLYIIGGCFVVSVLLCTLCLRELRARRRLGNLQISRDRAQLDLQMLSHHLGQSAVPSPLLQPACAHRPSGTPPCSIPPAPPSSSNGLSLRCDNEGGAGGNAAGGSADGSASGSADASASGSASGLASGLACDVGSGLGRPSSLATSRLKDSIPLSNDEHADADYVAWFQSITEPVDDLFDESLIVGYGEMLQPHSSHADLPVVDELRFHQNGDLVATAVTSNGVRRLNTLRDSTHELSISQSGMLAAEADIMIHDDQEFAARGDVRSSLSANRTETELPRLGSNPLPPPQARPLPHLPPQLPSSSRELNSSHVSSLSVSSAPLEQPLLPVIHKALLPRRWVWSSMRAPCVNDVEASNSLTGAAAANGRTPSQEAEPARQLSGRSATRGPYRKKSIDELLWPGAERSGWKRHMHRHGAWVGPDGSYFDSAAAAKRQR